MADQEELKAIRAHLDAVAGAQIAMSVVVRMLLGRYRGNKVARSALEFNLKLALADVLGTGSSDEKLRGFEQARDALLKAVE
jgi:hypothetical protein